MDQRTVCIIDDNRDIREIYGIKFRMEGFSVVMAADGEEGLRVVRAERPDVILLDIQMPKVDGITVLRELRADTELSHIPVVILSNIDSDDVFREVSDLGAAEYYLIKSLVDPQKVLDVASEAIVDRQPEEPGE